MTTTPRQRDRFRLVAGTLSAATAVGALTATGWLAGVAQAQQGDQQDDQQPLPPAGTSKADRAGQPVIVYRQRPVVRRVTTRYVEGTATAPVGGGGSVSALPPAAPAPAPAPAPPAPAPHNNPPPAPTSGS